MEFNKYKIEVYIPEKYITLLRDELNKINACTIGKYDNCISTSKVRGYWRPLDGSKPFDGEIGKVCEGTECKVEINCDKEKVRESLKVIRDVHPYEEPVINVIPIVNEIFE